MNTEGLNDWNEEFPVWPALQLSHFLPGFPANGVDLIEQLLVADPKKRLSARESMCHSYFDDIDENMTEQ
jgi:serine/threonine protein kinase